MYSTADGDEAGPRVRPFRFGLSDAIERFGTMRDAVAAGLKLSHDLPINEIPYGGSVTAE